MEGQVNLLGVTIELASAEEALVKTQELLEDTGRHTIRFVGTKACTLASENEECARLIAESDYVLPAGLSTEQGIKELVEGYREVFWHRDYFDALFKRAAEESKELYFVTSTTKKYQSIADSIHADFPYLSIHGKALEELDGAEIYHTLANDINAIAPDILFFYVGVEKQNELIVSCQDLINASLLICGQGMLDDMIETPVPLPEEASALEKKFFTSVVNFFKKLHTTIVGALFKKRVKDSRRDEQNGNEESLENHD